LAVPRAKDRLRGGRFRHAKVQYSYTSSVDDKVATLRIKLRLARFRLEGESPHGPAWEAASEQVARLERDLEELEDRSVEPDSIAREPSA